jgi:hypothetical protein
MRTLLPDRPPRPSASLAHAADPFDGGLRAGAGPGRGGRALQGPGHQWRWPISRAEAQAAPALAAHFDEIDANKDGQITPKEFRAYHRTLKDAKASAPAPPAGGTGGAFAKLDKNGDGQLSRDEVAGHPRLAAQFDTLDTNHDGQLSPAELAALRKKP